jgi:uncharacterized protein YjiS (DUF1127 family)
VQQCHFRQSNVISARASRVAALLNRLRALQNLRQQLRHLASAVFVQLDAS